MSVACVSLFVLSLSLFLSVSLSLSLSLSSVFLLSLAPQPPSCIRAMIRTELTLHGITRLGTLVGTEEDCYWIMSWFILLGSWIKDVTGNHARSS